MPRSEKLHYALTMGGDETLRRVKGALPSDIIASPFAKRVGKAFLVSIEKTALGSTGRKLTSTRRREHNRLKRPVLGTGRKSPRTTQGVNL